MFLSALSKEIGGPGLGIVRCIEKSVKACTKISAEMSIGRSIILYGIQGAKNKIEDADRVTKLRTQLHDDKSEGTRNIAKGFICILPIVIEGFRHERADDVSLALVTEQGEDFCGTVAGGGDVGKDAHYDCGKAGKQRGDEDIFGGCDALLEHVAEISRGREHMCKRAVDRCGQKVSMVEGCDGNEETGSGFGRCKAQERHMAALDRPRQPLLVLCIRA